MEPVTLYNQAEVHIIGAVQWLKLGVELVGALIIALGILVARWRLVRALWAWRTVDFTDIRLTPSRYLALALEFQLGADILSTSIALSWDQIGRLGAIAIIRTARNFFLSKEMQEERRETGKEDDTMARARDQA